MNDTPFVSVVVPVYNGRDLLEKCLQSLMEQTYPVQDREILVVDNGSQEDISGLVHSIEGVRFFEEKQPGSYAARNKALDHCRGEVLAFTDADCITDPNWLDRGVGTLIRTQADMVGGNVELFPKSLEKPTGFEVVDMISAFPQKVYVEQRDFAVTANLFSKREVFQSVGPFMAELESGGDMEFGQRAVSAGFNLVYEPECVVHHPARSTLDDHRKKIARVTRGKKAKGDIEPDWDWRRWTRRFIPPLFHSFRSAWMQKGLPFKSKVAGAFSLIAIHYVKEWEEHRAREAVIGAEERESEDDVSYGHPNASQNQF